MSAVDAARSLPSGEQQGLALFATHGVADSVTTLLAVFTFGPAFENNYIIRHFMIHGYGWAIGVKLLLVGAVALTYPRLARLENFPTRIGWVLATAGLLIALINLWVVLG